MKKMKKDKIKIIIKNITPLVLFVTLSLVSITNFSSCTKEDDIPPPSAYVPPEPDTTGACVFLYVLPELTSEEALNFECEGPEFTFFGERDGTILIEYSDNPATNGINDSEKAVKVTQSPGLESWAGFFFDLAEKIDFSTYQGIKIKVYSPAEGMLVNLKLEDGADGSISTELAIPTTKANDWEEMTFTFSPNDTEKFDRVVLFFDFLSDKDAETIFYFDDIIQGEGEVIVEPTEPTIAAPSPILPETEVISIYSDVYEDVPGTDFNPNWGQRTEVSEIQIEENNILKYDNLNYQGTVLETSIDVSGKTFLHIDYWTANSTALSGYLISPGPLETGHDFELILEEWVGVDIPLSEFSSVVDLMDIFQMKFEGNGTVYLDNIYFHNGQITEPTTPAPEPTRAEEDVISLFSDSYTNVEGTDFNPNWGQLTVASIIDIDGNNTLLYEGLNYQGTTLSSGIDVTGMEFVHIDYWTADSNGFKGFLISPGPTETSHTFEITKGEWVSVDIPLSEFSSVVDLTNVFQLKFEGDGTIYLDNIYFFK